jgi:hypothetical protein
MTSWPWMKGVGVGVADAIPPVDELDDRPSVKGLIEENRIVIDQVRIELEADPLYDAGKHDQLWILRFLLSHKLDKKRALKAAKTALIFRNEHKLDEKDIRFSPVAKNHENEIVRKHQSFCQDGAVRFEVPDKKRGVVGFILYSAIDQHSMVKEMDKAHWLPALGYISEWSFQWVDYVTRTTGRFTKSIRLIDTRGFALSMISYEGLKLDGEAMGVMEDCYPQMLQGIFVCNPPSWIHIPWQICRKILPKRLISKIDFVRPDKNEKERKRILKYISEDNLPSIYGGKNTGMGSGVGHVEAARGEEEADAADLDTLKQQIAEDAAAADADEEGNGVEGLQEVYDDIPTTTSAITHL